MAEEIPAVEARAPRSPLPSVESAGGDLGRLKAAVCSVPRPGPSPLRLSRVPRYQRWRLAAEAPALRRELGGGCTRLGLEPALTGCPCPQNGGECLRAYVSVALEQVAQWRDEQGHSGLWYVMRVVSQLLDPRTSEFTAAFVGRLVSTLIARAGRELGESLDQILRAVLSKMQQAETLSVMQVRGRPRGGLGLCAGP